MNLFELIHYTGLNRISFRKEQDAIHYHATSRTIPGFIDALRKYKPLFLEKLRKFEGVDLVPAPLSYNQRSLWINYQMLPSSHAYNVVIPFTVTSSLDRGRFQAALSFMVNRHAQLRCVFDDMHCEDGVLPMQFTFASHQTKIEVVDAEGLSDERIRVMVEDYCKKPFDLVAVPPFRAVLITCPHQKVIVLFLFHHIVCDAWSLRVFIEEFNRLYSGSGKDLLQSEEYTRFSIMQHDIVRNNQDQVLRFWRDKLANAGPGAVIPEDRVRPPVRKQQGASFHFHFNKSLVQSVNDCSRSNSITPFAYYMGCLQILLMIKTGTYTFTTGILTHGRPRNGYENTIGYFVNPLPLLCSGSVGKTIGEHIRICHRDILDVVDNQYCPFPLIIEKLSPQRDRSRPVLFNILFNMLHEKQLGAAGCLVYAPDEAGCFRAGELEIQPYPVNQQEGQFDLTMELLEQNGCIHGIVKYDTDLYNRATIVDLAEFYKTIIECVVREGDKTISDFTSQMKLRGDLAGEGHWQIAVASTFTAEMLGDVFEFWKERSGFDIRWNFAPYNQLLHHFSDPTGLFVNNCGYNVVLVRMEDLVPVDGNGVPEREAIFGFVGELLSSLRNAASGKSVKYLFILCPSSPLLMSNAMFKQLFDDVEIYLKIEIEKLANVFFMPSSALLSMFAHLPAYEPIIGIIAHVPYTELFYTALGTAIIRRVHALSMSMCKAIIVDCDNTLWKGVAGEDSLDQVSITEPYRRFQNFLKQCGQRGILICLCSRNNREDVVSLFENHPDMVLSMPDIMFDRVNWNAKSANVLEIIKEANLSLSGIFFIDDNPAECAEVRANVPGITVIELSPDISDPGLYVDHYWGFDVVKILEADQQRNNRYIEERSRRTFSEQMQSYADFIDGLNLNIIIRPAIEDDCERMSQLTYRTRQFTIASKAKDPQQMLQYSQTGSAFVVEAKDRFGDYGLIGVLVCHSVQDTLVVETFLLSCRALNRGIEHRMLAFLGERATLLRAAVTRFQVTSSGKNQPLLLFFTQVIGEFERQDETGTCFDVPSEVLKNIRFNPLEPQTVQSPVSVGEIPATTVENRGFSPAVLDNIARELSDVEVLHRGVIELRKRKRAVHQISVNEENPGETSSDPEIEKVVKEIWTEQLGIEPDSIHKNFFDVGGNSFMLPFIAVQLKEKLGCDVSMIELFQFTTIVALTEHICVGKRLVNTYSAINQIAKKQMDARLQMRKKTGF